jgi:hypothetical protein
MTISNLKDMGLHRRTLAVFATCGLIIAASQGVVVCAQAQDAPPSYVAPLDLGWGTYSDFTEYPDFLPNAPRQPSFAARDTTGVNTAPSASGRKDTAVPKQDETNAYPYDIYHFAP